MAETLIITTRPESDAYSLVLQDIDSSSNLRLVIQRGEASAPSGIPQYVLSRPTSSNASPAHDGRSISLHDLLVIIFETDRVVVLWTGSYFFECTWDKKIVVVADRSRKCGWWGELRIERLLVMRSEIGHAVKVCTTVWKMWGQALDCLRRDSDR